MFVERDLRESYETPVLTWDREVEFMKGIPIDIAARKLGELFKTLEDKHFLKYTEESSLFVDCRSKAKFKAEKKTEASRIRSIKEVCFALLLTSVSTITMSCINCGECKNRTREMSKYVFHHKPHS